MNTAPQEDIAINTTDLVEEQVASEETVAVQAEPQAPLQHGLDHLKSRLIIAATAWNNTLGAGRREELLVTNLVADSWAKIADNVANDVIADAEALNEVIWKPISYLINEIVTGKVNTENRKYAAILTTGQYVYLRIEESNFKQVNETGDETVPAYKIVMIRETSVDIKDDLLVDILPKSEYVRSVLLKPVSKMRYAIKELQDERNFQKKTAKRRIANKIAKAQKRKTRK